MKYYASGADLAKDMGCPLENLVNCHEKHYQAAKKMESDPDGGPFPAYPSGKCWDEASGKTGSGKKFYLGTAQMIILPTLKTTVLFCSRFYILITVIT